jgi:hypothetical protein
MATKAQRFKAEEIQRARRPSSPKLVRAPQAKPHNLGARAGKNALVRYEDSAGPPSRKSTRKSRNHQRPDNPLERAVVVQHASSDARAARASVKAISVSGKSRGPISRR